MTQVELLLASLAALGWLTLARFSLLSKISSANPVWYFAVMNTIMVFGTLPLLDLSVGADRHHFDVLAITAVLHIAGALVVLRRARGIEGAASRFWDRRVEPIPIKYERRLWWLIIGSGVVSTAYFFAVGYSVFITGIVDSLRGTESDLVSLRLESYAGDRYFAPGYVNQFKNLVFPLCSAALIQNRLLTGRSVGMRWLLVPLAVLFLVGAGQRGAFVIVSLMVALYVRLTSQVEIRVRQGLAPLVSIFTIFSLLSFLQGRFSEGESVLSNTVGAIWHRVMVSNQSSSVAGFRVVDGLGIVNGREFLDAALGLLPGHSGSNLSSIVFASLYGGTRGTSPVSTWGSLWHNGGWVLIVVGAVLLGAGQAAVYRRLILGSRSSSRLLCYSGTIVLISTWIAGSFTYMLNSGLVGIVLIWLAFRRVDVVPEPVAIGVDADRVRVVAAQRPVT